VQALVISRFQSGLNAAVLVGAYASLGFFRTAEAWRNVLILGALLLVALGGNSALLKWRATVAGHKRRKAEAELLKSE
jgi:hypothetical protein